ncbi:MAG: MATE family efflux transporter [Lachnospiraceae bacterium]|nr:MATE family efflux transporter [Lachnospiraceae bacterium]
MKKLIGTKEFYKKLLLLAVPIMVQNAITNFVGFLDNIMVGQLGTEPMSGVAIVNQIIFVFNLLVFGGLSGAGIFGAQFYGKGDDKGVRDTFRFKLIMGLVIIAVTLFVLLCFGQNLIEFYLLSGETENHHQTFLYGKEYLMVILLEIIPFVLVQIYASTLRETGETMVPMMAGVTAVFVNLVFNYILIFGKFGAPKLGVMGAAAATVIARITECIIVVAWTHKNRGKNGFIQGAYRSLRVPLNLAADIVKKGSPLLANEVLWAGGVALINQCLSVKGLEVVASTNISSTIANLFNVVFIAMGSAVAILVGQQLGASDFEGAKATAGKVIAFSVFCTLFTSLLMIVLSGIFPGLYKTTGEVREMAGSMIRITAYLMPLQAFLHAAYFTIRSGGRTVITFLFDSGFSWCVAIPFIYCLVHFTGLGVLVIYTLYYLLDIIKALVGFFLLKKGIWIQNIVESSPF